METKYLYLVLMLFTLSYPLAQSFEHRIKLYKKWKPIFKGIVVMALVFIPWDIWFTYNEIWWFATDYTTGISLFELPVEEWMFFFLVPYACVFIYEVLNYYVKWSLGLNPTKYIWLSIATLCFIIGLLNTGKWYTLSAFMGGGVASLWLWWKCPAWSFRFLLAFVVSLIPFLLVNGALTGAFTNEPVVNYNNEHNLGIRIFTIPLEDVFYNLLMLFIVIMVYERNQLRIKR